MSLTWNLSSNVLSFLSSVDEDYLEIRKKNVKIESEEGQKLQLLEQGEKWEKET